MPGKSAAPGGVQGPQAVVQREPARRLAEGDRGRARRRRQAGILSRRLGDAAARGDRRGARTEPGQHRLLERLRRDHRPARPDLPVAGRRGDLHRARFPGLQDLHPGRRRGAGVASRRPSERADVDAILAAVTAKTKIVFLANPNNPTGTYLPFEEVRRLHAGLPKNVLLVLDAAYAEYVRRNDYEAGVELRRRFAERRDDAHLLQDPRARRHAHRLDVCVRRISSMRINRMRGPFNVNAAAIEAGVAALQDRGACRAHRRAQRPLARAG